MTTISRPLFALAVLCYGMAWLLNQEGLVWLGIWISATWMALTFWGWLVDRREDSGSREDWVEHSHSEDYYGKDRHA